VVFSKFRFIATGMRCCLWLC